MIKFYKQLDKKQAYLIAVSGGADSMFLLDNLHNAGFKLFVVHVNYQKRADSFKDENVVTKYCMINNIKYQILHVNAKNYRNKINFQEQARNIRYDFFNKVAHEQKIFNLVVAHHLNDLLETYLFQKQRKSYVEYFGLQAKRKIKDLIVYRPMLNILKNEILQYLRDKQILYHEDSTNETNIYLRNRIRKKINKLDQMGIKKILDEIEKRNQNNNIEEQKMIKVFGNIVINDKINCEAFLSLNIKWQQKIVYRYVMLFGQELLTINKSYFKIILNVLQKATRANIYVKLNEKWCFVKEYNNAFLTKPIIKVNYNYTIEKLKNFRSPYINLKLKPTEKSIGFYVDSKEFPIYVTVNNGDEKIKTKVGTKKIQRLFIDNKIGVTQRINWPVIYNNKYELIAVPMLAIANTHLKDKSNWFMLK